MATKTTTTEKTKDQANQSALQEPATANLPATMSLRLPYPRTAQESFGIDHSNWIVLTDVIFPNATTPAAVMLALRYCKARSLDIMKRVVNIVPMYSKALGKSVDTIWPGIAEVRITATRTGDYAGRDAEAFGPLVKRTLQNIDTRGAEPKIVKEVEVEFPEWCQLTVYKIVRGLRCAFVGPKVYWEEAYATESRYSKIPNEMWNDRRHGQLAKCAEAAALRSAFPEETGGQMTAEEMHGRVLEGDINPETMIVTEGVMVPPRPKESDFARKPEPKSETTPSDKQPAATTQTNLGPDGRPEPPLEGEVLTRPEVPQNEEIAHAEEPSVNTNDAPSEAYMGASNWLDEIETNLTQENDLEGFKKRGRAFVDGFDGLTDDERDMIRGRFTTLVLTEQSRRSKKGKR